MPRPQQMHRHSLDTYRDERDRLGIRALAILELFKIKGPMTDWQTARAMGHHRSYVQPRISELVRDGLLTEIGTTKDPTTGKTVRVCGLPKTTIVDTSQLPLSLEQSTQ